MFSSRDLSADYSDADSVKIELKGNSATASSNSVKINGSTLTITESATYIVSGSLNGMLIIDAPKSAKLQIVLSDASITNESSAAIYIKQADKVFLTLAQDTENTLACGESFTAIDDSNIDSAVFSKQDLTVNGKGALEITSPAGHGIVSKDDLIITAANINVTSASHAIDANDSIRISGASVTAKAGKDGIHAENNDNAEKGYIYIESGVFDIAAEGDGISAAAQLQIDSGKFNITAGGGSENGTKEHSDNFGSFGGGMGGFGGGRPSGGMGGGMGGRPRSTATVDNESDTDTASSMKGIKSGTDMLINGGEFSINSADDSIHSNASATVKGGSFNIKSGDDAVHAEDTLTVAECDMEISESYEGLEALHIKISGGNIKLKASDDGLNAAGGNDQSGISGGRDGMFGGGQFGGMSGNSNGSIVISGGSLYINASGDGIDANGTLEITGGYTTVTGPTQGDTATLDYDKTGIISGGTFIGTGAQNMAQSLTGSGQGVIALSAGNQAAGTQITVYKGDKAILTHAPELNYQIVIISSPDIKSGDTYKVSIGENSGEFEAK